MIEKTFFYYYTRIVIILHRCEKILPVIRSQKDQTLEMDFKIVVRS